MPKTAPKLNMYVMHGRDFVLRTRFGHSIHFKLDDNDEPIPTHVPYACIEEAQKVGAVPVKGQPKVPEKPAERAEPAGQERNEKITEAIETILERNDAKDFTAGGVPKAEAVKKIVGFNPDRTEINRLHQAVRSREA